MADHSPMSRKAQTKFNRFAAPKLLQATVRFSDTHPTKKFLVQYRNQMWRFATKTEADNQAARFNK